MGVKPRLRFKPITFPPAARRSLHAATRRLYCTSVNRRIGRGRMEQAIAFWGPTGALWGTLSALSLTDCVFAKKRRKNRFSEPVFER